MACGWLRDADGKGKKLEPAESGQDETGPWTNENINRKRTGQDRTGQTRTDQDRDGLARQSLIDHMLATRSILILSTRPTYLQLEKMAKMSP